MEHQNGILEDIGAEIGFEATSELVAWFGGAQLYVPEVVTDEHPICRVIGLRRFERLVAMLGGETISLPENRRYDRSRRNRAIAAMVAEGYSDNAIADRHGITPNQIKNIRVKAEQLGILPMILRRRGWPQISAAKPAEAEDGQMALLEGEG